MMLKDTPSSSSSLIPPRGTRTTPSPLASFRVAAINRLTGRTILVTVPTEMTSSTRSTAPLSHAMSSRSSAAPGDGSTSDVDRMRGAWRRVAGPRPDIPVASRLLPFAGLATAVPVDRTRSARRLLARSKRAVDVASWPAAAWADVRAAARDARSPRRASSHAAPCDRARPVSYFSSAVASAASSLASAARARGSSRSAAIRPVTRGRI